MLSRTRPGATDVVDELVREGARRIVVGGLKVRVWGPHAEVSEDPPAVRRAASLRNDDRDAARSGR